MRKCVLIGAAALLLVACGGGNDKQKLVAACIEGGESEANCSCLADAAEENLSDKLFGKLVDITAAGDDGAAQIMSELTQDEQSEFFSFAMRAAVTCGAGLNVNE
ncbi:MAG: hypothetical protein AAGJ29_01300 [Pseudomonadota bacterium]